ncbi:TetR/AcrR family transcriptional regulator [Pseudovibrio exalbescens]|uniref:HTH tetR-type domain-containing protein n=1 Tax=Pseudovibrio exalbescens TaxID=197461 RepID=A0A1U7JLT1_9HYPH|nr:TetR/AcrR family transcriptional regulator [Pseudovibrio exalbescens]OKL45677.1 hypothetical protein A3843_01715 [Pseudovibrio exalbescens]
MTKKEDILEAATRLFNEYGYTAVGVDLIRDEANVSKMTIYKHFKTKDYLVEAVLNYRHQKFSHGITSALEGIDDPEQRLRAIFNWHLQWFFSPDFFGCMFVKAMGEFHASDPLREVAQGHKQWIANVIADILRDMGREDVEPMASYLQMALEGMIVNASLFRSYEQLDTSWRVLCDTIGITYQPLEKPNNAWADPMRTPTVAGAA